jgi:ABC-type antimicrobial peptide transport system permease subunit
LKSVNVKRRFKLPPPYLTVAIISVVLALTAFILAGTVGNGLYEQRAAEAWSGGDGSTSYTQVSVFYGRGTGLNYDAFARFNSGLETKLIADITASGNVGARMWFDAASTDTALAVARDGTTVQATATGVIGEFFRIHSLDMMSGQTLKADEAAKDIVLLDWDTAWRLFGASDIVDMRVEVGGIPCVVGGVFEKSKDDTVQNRVYVSYELLERLTPGVQLSTLEVVLPNPIGGYGVGAVTGLVTTPEIDREIVENAGRFTGKSLFSAIGSLGGAITRTKAIALPYWENTARVRMYTAAIFYLLALVFTVFPAIIVLVFIIKLIRRRRNLIPFIKGRIDTAKSNKRASKNEALREGERNFEDDKDIELEESHSDDTDGAHARDTVGSVR